MPEARVQLSIEIETEGAEELTTLRRELEQLGQTGEEAFARVDEALNTTLTHLEQSRSVVGAATESFLQSHRQLFRSLEPLFDGFFSRVLAGAHSFRDVLRRLLEELLDIFLRLIERMVAGWLSGFLAMTNITSSFGGLLGDLLNVILGGGGGGGITLGTPPIFGGGGFQVPPVTPPTFPTGGFGFGLSAAGARAPSSRAHVKEAAMPVNIQIFIDGRGDDPEEIAAFTLRQLKRELADRGLRIG